MVRASYVSRLCFLELVMLILSTVASAQIPIPAAGKITTIAGVGTAGFEGDGGFATSAEINIVSGLAADSSGNLYFADSMNNRVRRIDASTGVVTTVAGNGSAGSWGDGGLATDAMLNQPTNIAVSSGGDLYIAEPQSNLVRKVAGSTGIITTFAGHVGTAEGGGDPHLAINLSLKTPCGVAVDSANNVYIADTGHNSILKVNASTGTVSTVAGTGTAGYAGDGGLATLAELNQPTGVVTDSHGNLFFAENQNHAIREITLSGVIATVAGNGKWGYSGDGGPAKDAMLGWPEYLAIDPQGSIFFDDYKFDAVRKIDSSTRIITTVAGTGLNGFAGDDGPATTAEFSCPFGVAVDASGNLYVADARNFRIRVVGGNSVTDNTTYMMITSSDPKPVMNESITLTASVVNGSNGRVSSGKVLWFSGNTSIGQTSVDTNGTTSIITALGAGGDQRFTGQYSGMGSSAGSTILHVTGFSLAGPHSPACLFHRAQVGNSLSAPTPHMDSREPSLCRVRDCRVQVVALSLRTLLIYRRAQQVYRSSLPWQQQNGQAQR